MLVQIKYISTRTLLIYLYISYLTTLSHIVSRVCLDTRLKVLLRVSGKKLYIIFVSGLNYAHTLTYCIQYNVQVS